MGGLYEALDFMMGSGPGWEMRLARSMLSVEVVDR